MVQLRALEEAEASARAEVAASAQRAADAAEALSTAKSEASAQAARLAHLEGEFTALQEMMGEVRVGEGWQDKRARPAA
jgi:chromosome segregation ATPase